MSGGNQTSEAEGGLKFNKWALLFLILIFSGVFVGGVQLGTGKSVVYFAKQPAELQEFIPFELVSSESESVNAKTGPENNAVDQKERDEQIYRYFKWSVWGGIGIILLGIFLGAGDNRKIIVFRNYNDLGLAFSVPALPVVLTLSTFLMQLTPEYVLLFCLVWIIAMSFWILVRTLIDNKSILKTLVAFPTKMLLGSIFILNVVSLMNPSGKTGRERARSRGKAMVMLTFLAPVIGMLVAKKEGYLSPSMLSGRGVRGIGRIREQL